MHHPKADTDRLYVKRKEGRRGLVQVETAYKAEIQGGSNMTGTDLCVNKPVTVPVIFEPHCN